MLAMLIFFVGDRCFTRGFTHEDRRMLVVRRKLERSRIGKDCGGMRRGVGGLRS